MNAPTTIDIETEAEPAEANIIPLTQFVTDFGDSLVDAVNQQNPPVFNPEDTDPYRDLVMDNLLREPFDSQRQAVHAISSLLFDHGEKAAVLNAEMGTGKSMMSICTSAVAHQEGYQRSLVICPPHLVYKWRREIMDTIPDAIVWILNGPDTLVKLLQVRELLQKGQSQDKPEFFIIGRVRMRMGYHWKPAFASVKQHGCNKKSEWVSQSLLACPDCFTLHTDVDGNPQPVGLLNSLPNKQTFCKECGSAQWTLMRPETKQKSHRDRVKHAVCKLPTIGPKTAEKLLGIFGEDQLSTMLADNVYEFVNLMDDTGELVFSDRQAERMERSLSRLEFSFGQGGYQPTEFIKRYLPDGYFSMLIVDEGHEYKNDGSAQGQAMGVLANKAQKVLLLTGTLMGGYASDLFFLLWRIMPRRMIEDGFRYSENGSLGSASMAFMREHGILQDIYTEKQDGNHRTAKGKRTTVRTRKRPGFGPKGICRYVLPYTIFLKLKDIGGDVLPAYREHYVEVEMIDDQADVYSRLESTLTDELRKALRKGDTSLMGVVLNVLLAWSDTCFREEIVRHPHSRKQLAYADKIFTDNEISPKEAELIRICKAEKAQDRRVLIYTTYTGKRDTATRLKRLLDNAGLKPAVLRSTVSTDRREEWILDQVDKGIDVMICNPELVKTGLDLLEFPTLVFMQSGYNVYTIQQASRRSWRIGQTLDVDVYFLGYAKTAQITCLSLMAEKIAVSQSTSGDMPDTGLDVLNQSGDSIEVALAKQLIA